MKTRLISFLLLIALVVTAMPLVSFATENEESTQNTEPATGTVSTMTEEQYNALYVQDGLNAAFDVMVLNEYWGLTVDHKLDTNGNPIEFPKSPMDDKYPHTGTHKYSADKVTYTFSEYDFQKLYVADDKGTPNDPKDDITYPYYVDRFDSTARDTNGNITAKAPYYIMQGTRNKEDTTAEYTESALYMEGGETEAQPYEDLAEAKEKVKDLEKADTADDYDYWIVNSNGETPAEDYHIMTCTINAKSLTGYSGFTKGAESYPSIAAANRKIDELKAANAGKEYWIVGDDTSLAYQAALEYYDKLVDAWLAAYTWKGPFLASGAKYPNTKYSLRNNNSFAYLATVADPVEGQGYLVRQYYTCSDTGLSFANAFPTSNPLPAGSAATLEAVTKMVNTPANQFLYMLNLRPKVEDGNIVGFYKDSYFTVSTPTVVDVAIDKSSIKTFRISLSNSKEENKDEVVFEQGNTILYSAVGTYPNNSNSCLIGYQNSFKNGRIYALRIYNKTLGEDEKAQNHFADIAKWFKLDVSKFAVMRDEFPYDAVQAYYKEFANFTFDSDIDEVRVAADAAYKTLADHIVYPEFTLDDYNELYVQDGLTTAFDVMALNKYWEKQPVNSAGKAFPTSPMLLSEYEYNNKTYDFTNCEGGYYVDRFTGDANAQVFTYMKCKKDMTTATNKTEAGKLHSHVSGTKYTLEGAKAKVAELNALGDGYVYYVVGETTSDAYKQAIIDYDKDVDEWLESYTWAGEGETAPSVQVDYINYNTAPDKQLSNSFKAYAPFLDPVAGQGYLHTQYTYCDASGIYYAPPDIQEGNGAATVEMVTRVGEPASGQFIFLHNQRLNLDNSASGSKITSITNFTLDEGATERNSNALDRTKADTLRLTLKINKQTTTTTDPNGKETTTVTYTGSPLVEQGNTTELYYASAGTYAYKVSNMIGHSNSFTNSRIYSLRVYNDELTPNEKAQNHFADIAKWYRLDIAELEKYNDTVKQYVYEAFADYTVDTETETRTSMQVVFDTALEEIVLLQFDKVLEFEGYRAKLQTMPGLRSTYSISKEAIEILEASGRKVIVGAMIAYANEERDSHDKLVAPTNGNGYDREGYKDEYNYIDGGVTYQEIYHTGEKKGEIDGVVGSILSEKEGTTDKEYKFAYTITYGNGQQTVANFEQELLYRGFVVIQDAEGNEDILYTDMTSSYFGNSISIYELCKHFEEYEGVREVDVDGEYSKYLKSAQIIKPLDTVENAPAKLYVTDGLLYNVNFDSATSDMTIKGNTNGTYAHEKFNGTADDFDRFVIAKKDGISPLSGGTAPIPAGGGWKFITPYRYSYWFDGDGKQIRPGANTDTFNNFVTADGDELFPPSVPKIDGEGKEIEGESEPVTYLTDGNDNPLEADTNITIGGVTKSIYTLIHEAPLGVEADYYMTPGVWTRKACTSEFGDKYFDAGSGTQVSIYTGGALDDIESAGKLTVELTVASVDLKGASFFIGPRFKFVPGENQIIFTATEGDELLASGSGYKDIQMNLNGREINTYSLTFDMNNNDDPLNVINITTNNKYILKAYGNGTQEIVTYGADQELSSETKYFHAQDQYIMDGNGIRNYAIRVYEKVLSADEISQNHFADIAIYNDLDLGEFRKLTGTQKLYVYKAFEGIAIDDKTVTVGEAELTLQQLLDKAVADAPVAE